MTIPVASRSSYWRRRNGLFGKIFASVAGYWAAVSGDKSVAIVSALSLLTIGVGAALDHWVEVAAVVLAAGLLVVTELINTAIEELCDYVQPAYDSRIGRIKDIGSAAVLTAFLVWLAVTGYELGKAVVAFT